MAKSIPGIAMFGLVCLMILPAPGFWGVLIGGVCSLVIVFSALVWLLDQMSSRVAVWYERGRASRLAKRRRRAMHAGSGIARKA